jgi:predicted SnoaL-like aldol condensation-catalyzing enzyme
MQGEYPDKSIEFVRAVAENDLFAYQTYQIWPDNDLF